MQFNIIYKTTNLVNSKIYVGKHIQYGTSAFDGYLGSGYLIKRSIEKYKEENFIRETLEITETEELAFEREVYWIDCLSATDRNIGYNIFKGGCGFTSDYMIKMWESKEHQEFMSQMMKECWKDDIFRNNIIDSIKKSHNIPAYKEHSSKKMKEFWDNEENRIMYIEAFYLIWKDESVIENHSKAMLKVWEDPNHRIKIAEMRARPEIKEKYSKALLISSNKPEYKEKLKVSTTNLWKTKEYRIKTINAQTEAQNRPEVKKKKSEATIGIKNKCAIFHYVLKDPTGIIYQTDCLADFCREYNIEIRNMNAVVNGKRNKCQGWSCISKTLRIDK